MKKRFLFFLLSLITANSFGETRIYASSWKDMNTTHIIGRIESNDITSCNSSDTIIIHNILEASNSNDSVNIDYRWLRNNIVISNSNYINYSIIISELDYDSSYSFKRQSKSSDTSVWQTDNGEYRIHLLPAFSSGSITSGNNSLCLGNAGTTISSSTLASGGDNVISYRWKRNNEVINNSNSDEYTPTVFNLQSGIYAFIREAKDNTCNPNWTASSGIYLFNIQDPPSLSLTSGMLTQSFCLGESISPILCTFDNGALSATVSGLPNGVTATINTAQKTLSISGTPTETGTFNFTISTISNGICSDVVLTGTLTVFSLPNLIITGIDTICYGGFTYLTVSGANTYTWATNTGLTLQPLPGDDIFDTIYPSSTIIYTYIVTGTDIHQCTSSAEIKMFIYSAFYAGAISSCDEHLCLSGENIYGTSIENTVSAFGNTPIEYRWVCNGIPVSNQTYNNYPNPSFSEAGTFRIVREARSFPCNSSWTESDGENTYTIISAPPIGIVNGKFEVCSGEPEVVYSITPDSNCSYYWTVSGGEIVGSANNDSVIINWNTSDVSGIINLSVNHLDCIQNKDFFVHISNEAGPILENIVSKSTVDGVPYMLIYPNSNFEYQWYKNEVLLEGENKQYYYPKDGIDHSACYQVYISRQGFLNCGSLSSCWTNELQKKELNIYPNPSHGIFTISANNASYIFDSAILEIWSTQGKLLYSHSMDNSNENIISIDIPSGFYVVKVMEKNGNIYTGKLIIK